MNTRGYKCNACGTGFEDVIPQEPEKSELKCPHCASTDITESEEVLQFLELLEEMGRTGG